MTDVTVLMGKNGSGKSLLLRSWRNQKPEAVHYVVPERTGELDFQPQFTQEEFTGVTRGSVSRSNFVYEYRRRIMSRVHTYFMTRGNIRGTAPISGPEELEQFLGLLLSDFVVELSPRTPPFALRHTIDNRSIVGVDQLSSGEAQLFTMGLDILTIAGIWEIENQPERIMLIDEPDAHIHPDLQVRLADFLLTIVDRFRLQIVVATHSTSLLAALGQSGDSKTSVVFMRRAQSDFKAQTFGRVQKDLAACLGGHVLMGPLFGVPLLLVEGDDDYQIWSQAPRCHGVQVSALPCHGDEIFRYQSQLENILSSLCESPSVPTGFALLDGDKALPLPSATNAQNHVRFLQLGCHESENLYLTDVVLETIGHTWETAKAALMQSAQQRGDKQRILKECHKWDRRTEDLKPVIKEVAWILDPKHVPWTLRVGSAIGRRRPTGDLAEFLGDSLVDALWMSQDSSVSAGA